MDNDALSAVLEDAGLSPYQAEAYVTLLEHGTATATAVAEACDVPDPRIYDVLRDLAAKGYVETYQQENLTARARDPAIVIDDLESRSERLLDAAAAIEDRWTSPGVADHELTVVKRFDTVFARARALIAEAELQITASLSLEQFRELEVDLAEAHDRGVLVFLTVWTANPDAPVPDEAQFVGTCTEARHRPGRAPFLTVVDRTDACFSARTGAPAEHGLLVEDRDHTEVFLGFYSFCLWRRSEVLSTERSDRSPAGFLDVYECVETIRSLSGNGTTVTVEVTGSLTGTAEPVRLSGTVREPSLGTAPVDPDEAFPSNGGRPVGFVIETDGGATYSVGGRGAVHEDIEATHVRVTDVSDD